MIYSLLIKWNINPYDSQSNGFILEYSVNNNPWQVLVNYTYINIEQIIVTDLKIGDKYRFRIACQNEAAIGEFSQPFEYIKNSIQIDLELSLEDIIKELDS